MIVLGLLSLLAAIAAGVYTHYDQAGWASFFSWVTTALIFACAGLQSHQTWQQIRKDKTTHS